MGGGGGGGGGGGYPPLEHFDGMSMLLAMPYCRMIPYKTTP